MRGMGRLSTYAHPEHKLSWILIALIKYHDQGNLYKEGFIWGFIVPER